MSMDLATASASARIEGAHPEATTTIFRRSKLPKPSDFRNDSSDGRASAESEAQTPRVKPAPFAGDSAFIGIQNVILRRARTPTNSKPAIADM